MAESHPIVLIHAAPWCGGCKQLLAPPNLAKLTKLIHELNPTAEIKVVYHEHYGKTNKVDEYPPFDYIPGFPTLMITDSTNCNRKGTMDKVKIRGARWNGKTIVKTQDEPIETFLRNYINMFSPVGGAPLQPPVGNVHKELPTTVLNGSPPRNSFKREERHFKLIGSSND